MLTIHWTTVLVVAIGIVTLIVSGKLFSESGGDYGFGDLIGCGAILIGTTLCLAILLIHAWGWL